MKKIIAILCFAILSQCKGGTTVTPPCTGPNCDFPSGIGTGSIYVVNSTTPSLLRFTGQSNIANNQAPAATISGSTNTTFSAPQYLFLDTVNNDLYITNANSILVYHSPSTINSGDIAPTRVIQTTVPMAPKGIAMDVSGDRLYVSDTATTDQILVFTTAHTLNATNLTAHAIITNTDPTNPFNSPEGLFFQSPNRLFVANKGGSDILVYDNVTTALDATSDKAADRVLGGSTTTLTTLNQPVSLLVAGTSLVVSNKAGNSITVYANAATVSGDVAPTRTIGPAGATTLSSPRQIFYEPFSDSLWVANSGGTSVLIYDTFSAATGLQAPDRTVKGVSTGFTGTITGVLID